nr:EOG090X0GMO [Cyclestheria hislopi]
MLGRFRILTTISRNLPLSWKKLPLDTTQRRWLNVTSTWSQKKMISVTFINRDGNPVTVKAKVGDTFLDAAVNNDIDLEGFGACEGTLSCSTCHIILKKEDFDKLPDKPCDEELDMLDLAFGLTDTSRLGCQITLTESMDGIVVQVPSQVSDARNR